MDITKFMDMRCTKLIHTHGERYADACLFLYRNYYGSSCRAAQCNTCVVKRHKTEEHTDQFKKLLSLNLIKEE